MDSILELIKDEIGDKDDDQLYYTEKYLSSLAQFTPDKKIIDKSKSFLIYTYKNSLRQILS